MPAPVFVDGTTPLNATTFNALGAVVDSKLDIPAGANNQYLKRVSGLWVPATLSAGDLPGYPADATKALRGDGTWGTTPSNKITTSTLAAGPPVAPVDGDIWIATAVDAVGTRWQFSYNAGSASAFKWEFIGGSPQYAEVLTSETVGTSGAYVDCATVGPSLTLARAGDYNITIGGMSLANNTPIYMSYQIGATAAVDADAILGGVIAGIPNAVYGSGARARLKAGLAAATTLTAKYKTTGGGNSFANRWMQAVPIRVS